MKYSFLFLVLLILDSCTSNKVKDPSVFWKSLQVMTISWEYLTISWILIDKNDFWKPINSSIVLNPDRADLKTPQAWSRSINWKDYWYYNWEWAKIEAEKLWKRLPSSEEWKLLLSWSTDLFNKECVWSRQWWSNIWSILEKWWKTYWSATEYVFDFDKNNSDYALAANLYNDKGSCDSVGAYVRNEKWQGYSARGIPSR